MARKLSQDKLKQQLMITMIEEQAEADAALLDRLTPASKRLIVSKPSVGGNRSASMRASGLHIPDIAMGQMAESGVMATVFAAADDVDPDIQPGCEVVVPEYSGLPLFLGRETPYWYIAEGDVQVIVEPEEPKDAA